MCRGVTCSLRLLTDSLRPLSHVPSPAHHTRVDSSCLIPHSRSRLRRTDPSHRRGPGPAMGRLRRGVRVVGRTEPTDGRFNSLFLPSTSPSRTLPSLSTSVLIFGVSATERSQGPNQPDGTDFHDGGGVTSDRVVPDRGPTGDKSPGARVCYLQGLTRSGVFQVSSQDRSDPYRGTRGSLRGPVYDRRTGVSCRLSVVPRSFPRVSRVRVGSKFVTLSPLRSPCPLRSPGPGGQGAVVRSDGWDLRDPCPPVIVVGGVPTVTFTGPDSDTRPV